MLVFFLIFAVKFVFTLDLLEDLLSNFRCIVVYRPCLQFLRRALCLAELPSFGKQKGMHAETRVI